jgi:hypothetical protein
VGIRCADHVTPSIRKSRYYFADSSGRSVGIVRLRTKTTEFRVLVLHTQYVYIRCSLCRLITLLSTWCRAAAFPGKWLSSFAGNSDGKMNVPSVCALNTQLSCMVFIMFTLVRKNIQQFRSVTCNIKLYDGAKCSYADYCICV